MKKSNVREYLLVGAPNVGKSTYYNKITWKVSSVGNVDRVTTTAFTAKLRRDKNIQVTDLPGIVSLASYTEDESVAFDYIFNKQYHGIVNIVSATSLKRDLSLTVDLAEAGVLSLININMIDEVSNIDINDLWITSKFKVPVNQISAKSNLNIKQSLIPLYTNQIKMNHQFELQYAKKIEDIIKAASKFIPDHPTVTKRSIIIQALNGNRVIHAWLEENNLMQQFNAVKKQYHFEKQDIISIKKTKDEFIETLIEKIVHYKNKTEIQTLQLQKQTKTQKVLDVLFLNKYISIPLFLLLITLIWFITFWNNEDIGVGLMGWIQFQFNDVALEGLKGIINESIVNLNASAVSQHWWATFVSEGIFGGAFTVLGFLPWIFSLLLLIGILEQIGILSRVGIVFDRIFKRYGLSGRAIINIITGVGCNIPSITMAKNSNSWREKITTVMIMPFISCSARVVVYGFISKIFITDDNWQWVFNLGITLFSMVVAVMFGYFFSNYIFRDTKNIFISELPRYRSPDLYVALKKVILDCYDFVKRVVFIVMGCNLVVWILTYTNTSGYVDLSNPDELDLSTSIMRYISVPFQILLYPLGIGADWRLTISLATAFPAKEITSSNIEILIGGEENLQLILQQLNYGYSAMLSFITFFSFYIPCMATVATMIREVGKKHTFINMGVGLVGAWIVSLIVYTFGGLIESIIRDGASNRNSVLLLLIGFFVLMYGLIYTLKQWKHATQKPWSTKEVKLHKYAYWTNTGLLTAALIATDVVLLTK